MAEGLKLVVSADVTQAEQALKDFATTASTAADGVKNDFKNLQTAVSSFGGGVLKFDTDPARLALGQFVGSIEGTNIRIKELEAALDKAFKKENVADIIKITAELERLKRNLAVIYPETVKAGKGVKNLGAAVGGVKKPVANAGVALTDFSRIIQDAPYGIVGVGNNITQLADSFGRLKDQSGSTGGALKALLGSLTGTGGLVFGISLAVTALTVFKDEIFGSGKAAENTKPKFGELTEAQKELQKAFDAAAGSVVSSTTKVEDLGKALADTSNQSQLLTQATINQGLAQFLFSSKSELVQQGLAKAIENQLKAQKSLLAFKKSEFKVTNDIANLPTATGENLKDLQKLGLVGAQTIKKLNFEATKPLRIASVDELNKAGIGLSKIEQQVFDINQLAAELGLNFGQFVSDPKKAGKGAKETADNIIAEAKRVADYFNDRSIRDISIEFSPFEQDEAANKSKAREFVRKFQTDFREAIREFGFDANISPDILMDTSGAKFKKNVEVQGQKAILALQKELDGLKKNSLLLKLDFDLKIEKKRGEEFAEALGIKNINSLLTDAQKQSIALAKSISGILTPAFQDFVGAIISGENPLRAFFQGIGQAVLQLIQKLIAAAIQAAILSALVPGSAGVGGFKSIFKGLVGFAAGGIVSGPTLAMVGEGRGTSRSNPEIIAPLDQLRGMIQGMAGNGGGGGLLTARLRGPDLLLSNARTSRSQSRNGARTRGGGR